MENTPMTSAETTARVPKPILVDGFLNDPYPTYRRFLEEGPIHFVGMGPGFQAAFSYPLVSSLMKDGRFSAKRTGALTLNLPPERRAEFAPMVKMLGLWLLFMDPPEHSRLRKLMNKGFSPQVAEGLRPRIERLVDRMLDEMSTAEEVEFMSRFAHPFPAKVIAELLDVPEGMHADLIGWSEAIALMIGNPGRTVAQCAAAQEALLSLTEYFRGVVAERRRNPGTDLISLLLEIEADGEVLTEDELYAQCIMLLFGGHETTRNLIGNGIYTLLQHPAQMQRLRDEPGLMRSCVEEMLRFQSPVQFLARIAKEDLELAGSPVRAGEAVLLMLGAANRDPQQFKEPDVFDPARLNNAHLAFGAGTHFCIGNQIARLEAQTAIAKVVTRFPKMGFAGETPAWVVNFALRGFRELPLRLG
jgi:cytochrome P450